MFFFWNSKDELEHEKAQLAEATRILIEEYNERLSARRPPPLNGRLLPDFDHLERELNDEWGRDIEEAIQRNKFGKDFRNRLCFEYLIYAGKDSEDAESERRGLGRA